MYEFTEEEAAIVALVGEFVDRDVRPAASELEHSNTYPDKLIEQMKEMGIFGLAIPEPWGEASVSVPCYAAVTEELARGWMSLAGAMGGHTVVAKLLLKYGTQEQKDRYLPKMATGEIRATMALTEPGGGSDLQAMRTWAQRDGDHYDAVRIHGGYGYSTEFDVERYFRDAPLMIVGEGTNEIQRNVIARELIKRNKIRK